VPRAVSMRHTVVPTNEREAFRARARETLGHYARSGCHYWLFEEAGLAGAYVEFFESPDAATLTRAHETSSGTVNDRMRLYVEVELT
jgi:hypothetical protein